MKTSIAVGIAALVGMSFGGIAVHTLHAQTKAPVYYVGEIDVTDDAGYQRDFVPEATKTIQSGGGRFLVQPIHQSDVTRAIRTARRWCLQLENYEMRGLCFRGLRGIAFEVWEDVVPLLPAWFRGCSSLSS